MSLNYRHRAQTKAIVCHVLTGLPENVTVRDIEAIFRGLGFLSHPFHFIALANGDLEDGRDVRAVGGFFLNTIDIAVLCSSDVPTPTQQTNLNDLIQALLLDHPSEKLEVITMNEQFRNTATA